MGGGARKRERSKAWAGKKQEKEAKLKAREAECGIRGTAKRNCDRDVFWAGVALKFARMGVGLGTHPGVVDGLGSLGCANFCKGGGQDPHGSDIGVGGGESAGSDIMGLGSLSCANFCKDGGQAPHGSDIGVRGSGGGDRTVGGSGSDREGVVPFECLPRSEDLWPPSTHRLRC